MNGTVRLTLRSVLGITLFLGALALAAEPEKRPAPVRDLTPDEIAVNKAIDRGVVYLKPELARNLAIGHALSGLFVAGPEALMGWALLECDVPKNDPVIQKTAALIRGQADRIETTYAVSLSIIFLDRLGDPADNELIQTFAARLARGRFTTKGAKPSCGWTYPCARSADEEVQLRRKLLAKTENPKADPPARQQPNPAPKAPMPGIGGLRGVPGGIVGVPGGAPGGFPAGLPIMDMGKNGGDNSNTQFAVLALWVAQRHGLNLQPVIEEAVEHFRRQQSPTDGGFPYPGWGNVADGQGIPIMSASSASMTCAGLMALAMGQGLEKQDKIRKSPAAEKGFQYLAQHLPARDVAPAKAPPPAKQLPGGGVEVGNGEMGTLVGQNGAINLYTALSLERAAMIYDLKTIGGKDWYAWASKAIVAVQAEDGSFHGGGSHDQMESIGTSFALLVLRRANVANDLTAALKKRLDLRGVGKLNTVTPETPSEPKSMLNDPDNVAPATETKPVVEPKKPEPAKAPEVDAETMANTKLEIAELWTKTDKAKALQKLEELIGKYPDTKAAERARKLIEELKKKRN